MEIPRLEKWTRCLTAVKRIMRVEKREPQLMSGLPQHGVYKTDFRVFLLKFASSWKNTSYRYRSRWEFALRYPDDC
jgi:hypothetical protein